MERLKNVEELKATAEAELIELFRTLQAATIEELHGEYVGAIPLPGALEFHAMMGRGKKGEWIGKAYLPVPHGPFPGQGYNCYLTTDGVKRYDRFTTEIGTSAFDGRPSFIMRYAEFEGFFGQFGTVDEIRRYAPGIYLGIGYVPGDTYVQPFLLRGPYVPALGPDDWSAELKTRVEDDLVTL